MIDAVVMGTAGAGEPRVWLIYIGGPGRYVERCDTVVSNGCTGPNFTPALAEVP